MTVLPLTTWRETLATQVGVALGIETVVAGKVEGPVPDSHLVCSWPNGKREFGDNVTVEEVEVFVRVFEQWDQRAIVEQPASPARLEGWAEQLQMGLAEMVTGIGPWEVRVVEMEFDMDVRSVTALVRAWQYNRFETGI